MSAIHSHRRTLPLVSHGWFVAVMYILVVLHVWARMHGLVGIKRTRR